MAKNYMQDVARMLGVELGELFEVTELGVTYKHYLKPDGLYRVYTDDQLGKEVLPYVLTGILTGKYKFKKLPWKPKNGEPYYYVSWLKSCGKWTICAGRTQYLNSYDNDTLRVDTGNCFHTKEEAEAAKYDVFEKLTGKKWDETYGKGGDDNATD